MYTTLSVKHKQDRSCRLVGRSYYLLLVYIAFYSGSNFSSHTVPLVAQFAACFFD